MIFLNHNGDLIHFYGTHPHKYDCHPRGPHLKELFFLNKNISQTEKEINAVSRIKGNGCRAGKNNKCPLPVCKCMPAGERLYSLGATCLARQWVSLAWWNVCALDSADLSRNSRSPLALWPPATHLKVIMLITNRVWRQVLGSMCITSITWRLWKVICKLPIWQMGQLRARGVRWPKIIKASEGHSSPGTSESKWPLWASLSLPAKWVWDEGEKGGRRQKGKGEITVKWPWHTKHAINLILFICFSTLFLPCFFLSFFLFLFLFFGHFMWPWLFLPPSLPSSLPPVLFSLSFSFFWSLFKVLTCYRVIFPNLHCGFIHPHRYGHIDMTVTLERPTAWTPM